LGQDRHHGYAGRGTGHILDHIEGWVAQEKPDVVLLMVGINDIWHLPTETICRNLTGIVEKIVSTAPDADVIVAQITPMACGAPELVEYNTFIRDTLVPSLVAKGKHVSTVDQYRHLLTNGKIDVSLFANGQNHPSAGAYDRMAETWFAGIQAVLPRRKSTVAADAAFAGFTLTQPTPYQVVQRDAENRGRIPVQGTCLTSGARVEARYERTGAGGAPAEPWVTVAEIPSVGAFSGTLPAAAGGWYRVSVRVLVGDNEVARRTVEKVGVGEVFITAGQSNAGNYGWPRQTPTEDRVAAYCQWCRQWRHGDDPQPGAGGSGGSPWPAMADILVRALDVPVLVVGCAAGGTSVKQWLPESKACYGGLKRALEFVGPHGARAILWHQGESDAFEGTSAEEYAKGMKEIIAQSRKDAGWEIPWGVAQASFLPDNPRNPPKKGSRLENGDIVRQGQKQTCRDNRAVFEGPLTDDLTGPDWRCDTIHFNAKGFREHGRRWAAGVLTNLFPTATPRPAGDLLTCWSPRPGLVAQRDAQNQGRVPVNGNFEGTLSRIEGRWTPMAGGTPSPWIVIADNPKDGYFSGTLQLPAGWYRLELRGLRDGKSVVERAVDRVGVGEVLVVMGGENVANFGQVRQTAKDPRVSNCCLACFERPLGDPQRGAIGELGSSWPALGDALATALDLPVEIVVVGYSGTIAQWKPGTPIYHGGILSTLVYSRRFEKGGYRAILWEVGEQDAAQDVKADEYAASFATILAQVRKDTGWEAPWVVAGTAYHPKATAEQQQAIREAQRRLCDGKSVSAGPTADDLVGPQWRFDGLHFTEAGLQEHGKRWAAVVQSLLFRVKQTGAKPNAPSLKEETDAH
jgi:lysophospholipase L1-like esterase